MPEIALAKVDPEAPLAGAALFACGLSTGLGAALNTAKVEPGSTCVVFGAGLVGLGAVIGCRLAGRRADRLRRPLRASGSASRRRTARPRRWSAGRTAVERIVELTGGFGADYTFEATGNVGVMRQAVESARMGWGLCTVAGVAGKGETLDVVPRFLITGRRIAGSSFGGVKGRDQVPQLVERWLARRDRRRLVRLAPPHARRRQPRLRADGGPGRDQERDRVLVIVERAEHPKWTSNAYLVAEGAGGERRARRLERRRGAAARAGRARRDRDHARPRHAPARRPRRPRRRAGGALRRARRGQRG